MAFTPIIWQDLPTQTTPLTSANLNKLVQTGIIIDEYDGTSTYAVGDYCIYNNTLYKCTTAITTAEEWNASHWTAVQISTELQSKLDKTIIVTATGTDLNDYKNDGTYFFADSASLPSNRPANIYGWVEVIGSSGFNVKQFWHRSSSIDGSAEFETFVRLYNKNADTWSDWEKFKIGSTNLIKATMSNDYTIQTANTNEILPIDTASFKVGNKLSVTSNGIKIGKGVSVIKTSGQIYYYTNVSGSESVSSIVKNTAQLANHNHRLTDNYEHITLPECYVNVSENDMIYLRANLSVNGGLIKNYVSGTFLNVEVIE